MGLFEPFHPLTRQSGNRFWNRKYGAFHQCHSSQSEIIVICSWKRSHVALLAGVINCLPSFPVYCATTSSAWRWQEIRFWPPMRCVYDWQDWVSGRWGCASAIPMSQPLLCRAFRWPFMNANTSSEINVGTVLHWRIMARCRTRAPFSAGVSLGSILQTWMITGWNSKTPHLPKLKCFRNLFWNGNADNVLPAELTMTTFTSLCLNDRF